MNSRMRHHLSSGFTLIELAITIPILLVTAIILFDVLYNTIQTSALEREKVNLVHDRQTAMNIIEDDTILASKFLPTKDAGYNDPYLPSTNGGAWSYLGGGSTSRALILRTYSTTTNPLASSRQPVFIGNSAGAECSGPNIYFNDVQEHNVIYFIRNGELYRRRVVDAVGPYCVGQYQKLSCPTQAYLTSQGMGTRNSACGADDELLASNVSNFTISYYNSKTSTTPLNVYAGGADPNLVTTALDAEITLTLSRTIAGKTLSSTSSLRMSKLNTEIPD